MANLVIPDRKDIYKGPLAVRGHWFVANLNTSIAWPVKADSVQFRGTLFHIIPITNETYPAVAINESGVSWQAAKLKLMRFLSSLSWMESRGILVAGFSGGNLPHVLGRSKPSGIVITERIDLRDLPAPQNPEAQIALALMREGRGLNHPAYSFLSFFKVIEISIKNGKARGEWFRLHVNRLKSNDAVTAIAKLCNDGVTDIGEHLYQSGRHAIAHATNGPLIDPDDPADTERLSAELPILLELAEVAIEEVFGIQTARTIYRKHLYEVAGFRAHFGEAGVQKILGGPQANDSLDIPPINVELRGRETYGPLRNLRPIHAQTVAGGVKLFFRSINDLVQFAISINFDENRLLFDWKQDVGVKDDGSALAARYMSDLHRFIDDYIGNGELTIIDADTGVELSRVDAFLPQGYFSNHDFMASEINRWRELAVLREAEESL